MEIHMEGSVEGYRMKAKGAQTIHRKRMSQEEVDKE